MQPTSWTAEITHADHPMTVRLFQVNAINALVALRAIKEAAHVTAAHTVHIYRTGRPEPVPKPEYERRWPPRSQANGRAS